jgi:hypothetical protein
LHNAASSSFAVQPGARLPVVFLDGARGRLWQGGEIVPFFCAIGVAKTLSIRSPYQPTVRDDMKSLEVTRLARMSMAAAGLLAGLAVMALTPASAQMSPEEACKDDAFRFCNNDIPDRDKVGACLRRNARSISPACRTFVVGGAGHHVTGHRTHVRTRVIHHPRKHK